MDEDPRPVIAAGLVAFRRLALAADVPRDGALWAAVLEALEAAERLADGWTPGRGLIP